VSEAFQLFIRFCIAPETRLESTSEAFCCSCNKKYGCKFIQAIRTSANLLRGDCDRAGPRRAHLLSSRPSGSSERCDCPFQSITSRFLGFLFGWDFLGSADRSQAARSTDTPHNMSFCICYSPAFGFVQSGTKGLH